MARLHRGSPLTSSHDVKRELKEFYAPKNTKWALLDVPQQQYIAIDGLGNPNTSEEYSAKVQALYAVAYTLEFTSKKDLGRDFVVGPLEGLWRSEDPSAFTTGAKDSWQWTMLISQPDWITQPVIGAAKEAALAKKKLPEISNVRHVVLAEGLCAQTLHLGPYDDEAPLLAALHGPFFETNHLDFDGDHHEIYLRDPRRTDPAKLKTVLRQPVRAVAKP